jgi:C1A family cysteine protease
MNNIKRTYGWQPDVPDQRDYLFAQIAKIPKTLPQLVDLRKECSAVEDQGQLGSCTANALAGALEFLENEEKAQFADKSRLFIYYNERAIEHHIGSDSGAMIRDGIKSLATWGCCDETLWPYNISAFKNKPAAKCYTQAKDHKISSYHRICTLDEMKTCLASGFPFVFGFTVYESFESQTVAKTGKVNMPKSSERALGGHAVMAVGYIEKQKRFIVRNSFGADWGTNGYFTMPYEYLDTRNLSDDFWVINK